ncbi:MAG TPA: HNH endonuclease signature motif containing protein, partial [Thermoanaerobaculia bacterium]|nr:HNH endonuclease signature motif containing protein [Thermoanaerobaculia bacterium]
GQTRFSNISEFYSLTMLVWQFRRDKLILSDRRRAQNAWGILVRLSSAVTMVRERQRKAQGAGPGQNLAADYLMSVQEGTDKLVQRQKRERMLLGLLSGIFEKKDERRGFSREQRRLLWHSEERKVCRKCGVVLTWANFQADHVNAHSRGGRTDLKNAQLLCGRCNRRKGARRAG